MAKCGAFLACIKKYTQQFYLSHVLTSYLHCFSCSDSHVPPRSQGSGADRRCGRDRCHSGGFLLRIMPPSWHPVSACIPHDGAAGGPFFCATTMALHRFASLGLKSRIDAAFGLFSRASLHRFPSLGLNSRIDARKRLFSGKSLHRFASLGLKSRIDARKRA